ncbi:metallophosphoesterase [Natrononativus amylolyticus]|uniref:metallophosphoesterase n=1 Tax=Natrononativus amylolyticus TaxID=2963434 RepID=UPI0020CD8B1A|nr:metallophosphoesterase [Natrononativus amylolyticus]
MRRRTVLAAVGTAIGTGVVGCLEESAERGTGADESMPEGSWTIAALPDTQNYAVDEELLEIPRAQAAWIADNADARNIVFAVHKGDVVSDGSSVEEWERMEPVFERLNGAVPYAVAIGDHDYAAEEDRESGAEHYREYVGPARFAGQEYFGGAGPNERSSYQYVTGGAYEFVHLTLEWEAPDAALEWAETVLENHADLPTIVTTHSYLRDGDGGRRSRAVEERSGDGNSGQEIFETLLYPNPQVFMILSANYHDTDAGAYHQVSSTRDGSRLYELFANYQHFPNGGNGWLRLIRFVPTTTDDPDRIEVETYSPWLEEYRTDAASEFHFELDFADRFG